MGRPKRKDKPHASANPRLPHGRRAGGAGTPVAQRAGEKKNPLQRFFKMLGPGLITGASDDDPSGIGTYAQAGASLGFAALWTALITFPMMWTIQFICAKNGM